MGQLLEWDEMVMMPEGSAALRGEHKAALAGVTHEKSTDASLGKLLTELAGDSTLNDTQKCVVREAKRRYCTGSEYWIFLSQLLSLLGIISRSVGALPIFSGVQH